MPSAQVTCEVCSNGFYFEDAEAIVGHRIRCAICKTRWIVQKRRSLHQGIPPSYYLDPVEVEPVEVEPPDDSLLP
jgi:hypothetical protein